MNLFVSLLAEARDCSICAAHLPHAVRPILQKHPQTRDFC